MIADTRLFQNSVFQTTEQVLCHFLYYFLKFWYWNYFLIFFFYKFLILIFFYYRNWIQWRTNCAVSARSQPPDSISAPLPARAANHFSAVSATTRPPSPTARIITNVLLTREIVPAAKPAGCVSVCRSVCQKAAVDMAVGQTGLRSTVLCRRTLLLQMLRKTAAAKWWANLWTMATFLPRRQSVAILSCSCHGPLCRQDCQQLLRHSPSALQPAERQRRRSWTVLPTVLSPLIPPQAQASILSHLFPAMPPTNLLHRSPPQPTHPRRCLTARRCPTTSHN